MRTKATKSWLLFICAVSASLVSAQRGPVRLPITPNQIVLHAGDPPFQMNAELMFFSNHSSGKVLSGVKWLSSVPTVAAIGPSSGLVTASASTTGTTLITVVSGPFHTSAWITVVPAAATFTSLTVTALPSIPTNGVPNGETQQFLATAHFSDGSSQDVTDTCAWSVTNGASSTTAASINTSGPAAGVATAHAASGTTFPLNLSATSTITIGSVTLNGSAPFKIGAAVPTNLVVEPPTTSLPFGQGLQLKALVTFSDNTGADVSGNSATTWSTSASGTATVDATHTSTAGTVTTTGIGPVTISASYKDPATAITVTGSDTFSVTHSFDAYGGLNNISCTATGSFHAQKIGNQWWFCTPAGHVFFMVGVYVVAPDQTIDAMGSSYDARVKIKYGDDAPLWAWATNRRLQSWGFNSLGPYESSYTTATWIDPHFPLDSMGLHSQPVKLPFIAIVRPAYYSMINSPGPQGTAYLSEAVKNMMFGHSNYYKSTTGGFVFVPVNGIADYYDSKLDTWLNSELTNTYFNSPWKALRTSPYLNYLLGVNCDDGDEMYGFGATDAFPTTPTGHNNNHLGWIMATMSPTQTANAAKAELYSDTVVHTKAAWVNLLIAKYVSIAALNTAWGSNYTTFQSSGTAIANEVLGTGNGTALAFSHTLAHLTPSRFSVQIKVGTALAGGDTGDGKLYGPNLASSTINYTTGAITLVFKSGHAPSSGAQITVSYMQNGWEIGSGVLDEDARPSHQAWMGQDYYSLTDTNANTKTDLNNMLETVAEHYFKSCHDGIKATFPNNLYFGPDSLSTWSIPSRAQVLQAANKYIDVMITGGQVSFTQPMIDYTEANFGDKPYIEGEFRTANADSGLFAYSDAGVGGFANQLARGQNYQSVVSTVQARAATSGSQPYIGTEWWQFVDNWGEKLDWGIVSSLDNVYDGKEAIVAPGVDPFGYPTGGEQRNYGNMLTDVEAANSAWINSH